MRLCETHDLGKRSNPRVAIILVNYRTADDTMDCARSLQKLAYDNYELVVVDNHSEDGSAEQIAVQLPEATVIRAANNGGYTAGNNLGIAHALRRGAEYVLIQNPDTLLLNPDWLRQAVQYLEQHTTVGAVGPRVHLRAVGAIQNTVLRFPWVWRRGIDFIRCRIGLPRPSDAETERGVEALNGVCVLFRAACLADVGLFDERTFAYIEDIDWGYRARRHGWGLTFLPIDAIVHRQRASGYERASKVDYLLKRNTLYFLMKNGKWLQAAFYTVMVLVLGTAWLALARFRGQATDVAGRWITAIGRAYWSLWTARWDRAMGRPRW